MSAQPRPSWLPPGWVVLVSITGKMPIYLEAERITGVTGYDNLGCTVLVDSIQIGVSQGCQEVIGLIASATAHLQRRCCR